MKSSNIVHQYFKKESSDSKILVKVNPIAFSVTELTVPKTGEITSRDLRFDDTIFEALQSEGFAEVNAIEFNLYLSGLIS
jgi:hypothetical protein